MKKSRIAIIVVSATLTIGTVAFATGMKHCHRNGNHAQLCSMPCAEGSDKNNCHHGETSAESNENQ